VVKMDIDRRYRVSCRHVCQDSDLGACSADQYVGLDPGADEKELNPRRYDQTHAIGGVLENLIGQMLYSKAAEGRGGKAKGVSEATRGPNASRLARCAAAPLCCCWRPAPAVPPNAGGNPRDPFERVNRQVFAFNDKARPLSDEAARPGL